MKRQIFLQKRSLRFVRWSKQKYAVFGSIGQQISIGVLSKNIVEKSLQKQTGILQQPQINITAIDSEPTPTDSHTIQSYLSCIEVAEQHETDVRQTIRTFKAHKQKTIHI